MIILRLKLLRFYITRFIPELTEQQNKLPDELTDKDMTEDDFNKWSNLFSQAREEFNEGKISGEEYIKKLGEIKIKRRKCPLHFKQFPFSPFSLFGTI